MKMCCTKKRFLQQCSLGQLAALQGLECRSPGPGRDYEECCMGCKLGVIVAAISDRCAGMASVLGKPWKVRLVNNCSNMLTHHFQKYGMATVTLTNEYTHSEFRAFEFRIIQNYL